MHLEMALLEWCMCEIAVHTGLLALMSTPLIIPNFSALQIPSDNNMLQASIICTAQEHLITLSPVIILRPAWPSRSIKQMTLKQRREG